MRQIIALYTLNTYNFICPLYLNKESWKELEVLWDSDHSSFHHIRPPLSSEPLGTHLSVLEDRCATNNSFEWRKFCTCWEHFKIVEDMLEMEPNEWVFTFMPGFIKIYSPHKSGHCQPKACWVPTDFISDLTTRGPHMSLVTMPRRDLGPLSLNILCLIFSL